MVDRGGRHRAREEEETKEGRDTSSASTVARKDTQTVSESDSSSRACMEVADASVNWAQGGISLLP